MQLQLLRMPSSSFVISIVTFIFCKNPRVKERNSLSPWTHYLLRHHLMANIKVVGSSNLWKPISLNSKLIFIPQFVPQFCAGKSSCFEILFNESKFRSHNARDFVITLRVLKRGWGTRGWKWLLTTLEDLVGVNCFRQFIKTTKEGKKAFMAQKSTNTHGKYLEAAKYDRRNQTYYRWGGVYLICKTVLKGEQRRLQRKGQNRKTTRFLRNITSSDFYWRLGNVSHWKNKTTKSHIRVNENQVV